jgi:hypothetical protein
MTFDEPAGHYMRIVERLGVKPIVRVPFDPGTRPPQYATELSRLSSRAFVMAEPVDSSEVRRTSQAAYESKFAAFLRAYGSTGVDVWEVGNELNGEWLGGMPYNARVGLDNPPVAKAYAAWERVAADRRPTALTLYYQPPQTVTAGYDMIPWARKNFAKLGDMRSGLTYVFVSYYEADNRGVRPAPSQWSAIFSSLHDIFPNARLGFGEIGLDKPIRPGQLKYAESIMNYYGTLHPSLPAGAGWVAGDFWWNAAEDFDPTSKPLFQYFKHDVVPFM